MDLKSKQGSMGIPEDMREEIQRQHEKKQAKARASQEDDVKTASSPYPDLDDKADTPEKKEEKSADPRDVGAAQIFKKLGIEVNEEDIQKIIFKGYIEKNIVIVKNVLTAKMKSLTTEEYDIVDEVMAKEAKDVDMSVDGFNARKSVLTTAMSLTEFNGKPLIKEPPKNEDGSVNLMEHMQRKRIVLKKMSATVVDKLIETHGAFSLGVNMGIRNPEDLLKNS